MNKKILLSLLAILLFWATNGFAQKVPTSRKLFTKTDFKKGIHPQNLVPEIPGVYIPPGTTIRKLEHRINDIILHNSVAFVRERSAHKIARDPKQLFKLQLKMGQPIFKRPLLSNEEAQQALLANQIQFANARANNKYEKDWEKFIDEREGTPSKGKFYTDASAVALDVYNFHVQKGTIEKFPRVRTATNAEGVLCEIPVNGLTLISDDNKTTDICPDNFVVIRMDGGFAKIEYRPNLYSNYHLVKF